MPLDPEFVADCIYAPGGLLLDEIHSIDAENHRVVASMPTSEDLPLTREQRVHPVMHPRHIAGGLMVHMTGMVAFVHSYYVLGLRSKDGWVGYGAKINSARFKALATPGERLMMECTAKQLRQTPTSVFARYEFRFSQNDTVVYEGDQSAFFSKIDPSKIEPK
ncbi:MAG: hypothetical protein ACRELY_17950 [Polyangiaceae bacterium]